MAANPYTIAAERWAHLPDTAEHERLAENDRFRTWERGWKAGFRAAQDLLPLAARPPNPYHWNEAS